MSFIFGHSAMSAIMTVHFTMRSSDELPLARIVLMFSNVCLVSASMPPETSTGLPSTTFVPIWPERNRYGPDRTADENGYGHGSVTLMNSGYAGPSDAQTPATRRR